MLTRNVEVYSDAGREWVPRKFQELVSGTIFRMYEPDGSPVADHTGVYELKAASDPYQVTISGYGDILQIDIYDPEQSREDKNKKIREEVKKK